MHGLWGIFIKKTFICTDPVSSVEFYNLKKLKIEFVIPEEKRGLFPGI